MAQASSTSITLDQLRRTEGMSVRAYNACSKSALHTLDDLLDYYRRYGSFTRVRNIGRLTDEELVGICTRYGRESQVERVRNLLEREEQTDPDTKSPAWSTLDRAALDAMTAMLNERLAAASPMVRDLLVYTVPPVTRSIVDFDAFVGDLAGHAHQTVDSSVLMELRLIRAELLDQARTSIVRRTPHDAVIERMIEEWRHRFGLDDDEAVLYRRLMHQQRFPLFHFLRRRIDSAGMDERERALIYDRMEWIEGRNVRQLEQIGQHLSLTRERVRQIAQTMPSRLRSLIRSIGDITPFLQYELLSARGRDLLIVDHLMATAINGREGTDFTPAFIAIVFESLLIDRYLRVEEDADGSTEYLVLEDLVRGFDFDAYIARLAERTEKRAAPERTVDLWGEVMEHWLDRDRATIDRVVAVCISIAQEEFGLVVDRNATLHLPRTARQKLGEMIEEVLRRHNDPLHVDQIVEALERDHPGRNFSGHSVRATLLREEERFCLFGHSTYGLAEWEESRADLESGSFADIAERFLAGHSRLCLLHEVAHHIMQFRDTKENNVVTTLKADRSGRFIFHEEGLIGLASRTYSQPGPEFRPLTGAMTRDLLAHVAEAPHGLSAEQLSSYAIVRYQLQQAQADLLVQRLIRDRRLHPAGENRFKIAGDASAPQPGTEASLPDQSE